MGDGWVEVMYTCVDAVGVDMQPKRDNSMLAVVFILSVVLIGQFILLNMFIGVVVDSYARQSVAMGVEPAAEGEESIILTKEEGDEANDKVPGDSDSDEDPMDPAIIAIKIKEKEQRKKKKFEKAMLDAKIKQRKQELSDENKKQHEEQQRIVVDIAAAKEQIKEKAAAGEQADVALLLVSITELEEKWEHIETTKVSEDVNETDVMCCGPCHRLVTHPLFEIRVGAVIMLNVLFMSIEHYNQHDYVTLFCMYANFGFTAFFILEAMVKIMGLGVEEFFSSGWNRFDMFVILISIGSIYIENYNTLDLNFNPTLLRILRVFRVTRLVRVLNASLGLQALLQTISRALPAILNVGVIMFMVFFIYACAGVEMFGKQGCEITECDGISPYGNFKHFPYAMLTLFRVTTGDNGYGLLKDMSRVAPNCDDDIDCEQNCCTPGGSFVAIFYFASFSIFANLVLLNVIVAILMTTLADASEDVLLIAIASQSDHLDNMSQEDLMATLGIEPEEPPEEFQMESEIMKEKKDLDLVTTLKVKRDIDKDVKKAPMVER